MEIVTISPGFQVVIPLTVRRTLELKVGQEIQAIPYDDRIELIPVKPIRSMRGFLKGIDTSVKRDEDRV